MAHILLVEDDSDQAELRRMMLERAGHTVDVAADPAAALAAVAARVPGLVLMDLGLPNRQDGEYLLGRLKSGYPELKVIVVTGWMGETARADAQLRKPVRSEMLLRTIARFAGCLLLCFLPGFAGERTISVESKPGEEFIAHVTTTTPEPEWITVHAPGRPSHQFLTWAAPHSQLYSIFLGVLEPGRHNLTFSRPVDSVQVVSAPEHLRHAPVLYARKNTIGRLSDVPLVAYATQGQDAGGRYWEYNIVFSNEDGGTSTRALMARWGRTTDIEYVYHVWVNPDGSPRRAIIQGKGHKDIEYAGRYEGWHPVLVPVTDNNMVHWEPETSVRHQLAPVLMDLSQHSREQIMDQFPATYTFSSQELQRENKLRPFGVVDGEKISDPRNYWTLEVKIATTNAVFQALLRSKGSDLWQGATLGIAGHWIERSGWIRTAIELPPGSEPSEAGFQCVLLKPGPGKCTVESIGKLFPLKQDFTPGANRLARETSFELPPGGIVIVPVQAP